VALNVTRQKIRALARLYADQRPGGSTAFIPDDGPTANDAGVNDLIALACTELYDLLVQARGQDYYATYATLNIVGGTSLYSLPSDFYQLLSLSLVWSSSVQEDVPNISTARQRISFLNGANWAQGAPKGFRLRATQIEILPTPTSAVTGSLVYVPAFPGFANDAAVIDGVNGWEKLVALRVAMEMRAIEEQPYADLQNLYEIEKQRITDMAADRDAGHTSQILDVDPEGSGYPITRATGRWWP
jgi:hypothetical protein